MPARFPVGRVLPAQPHLDQLRKQAKELLKSFRAADELAVAEVRHFERHPNADTFSLADAQRVLARAYGFASWAKLKQHVDGVNVTAFCAAVESGDIAAVRKLAKARPELVNAERGGGYGEMQALHVAVLNRDADMTRALMALGADARIGIWPHREATTAHIMAGERGYEEIVAIIEAAETQRRQQWSAPGATIGSQTDEVLQAILENRSDDAIRLLESDLSLVGVCNPYGVTPLHVAALRHNPPLVAWLLAHGAPVDADAPRDVSPAATAIAHKHGKTPLDFAATVAGTSAHGRDFAFMDNSRLDLGQFDETVRLLRGHGARLTPRAAVASGDSQAVLEMHRAGRLHNDIHFFRGGLLSIAVRVNRLDMLTLLLDLGIDIDESTVAADGSLSWGMPLWFATMCGRQETARLLLARGADANAIIYACGDALSIAEGTKDEDMKAMLLAGGAAVTVENVADHATARAILDGKISAQSLNVQNPTPIDLAEQMLWASVGSDAEIVQMCLPYVPRERSDPWWNYVFVGTKLPESLRLLLEHGVDPDVLGSGRYTLLHHLASLVTCDPPGRHQITEQTRLALASLLLDAGASLAVRDPLLKSTPLGWACRFGQAEVARLFLARGADPMERDAEPWATPLAWAAKRGHEEIAELLRASGAG